MQSKPKVRLRRLQVKKILAQTQDGKKIRAQIEMPTGSHPNRFLSPQNNKMVHSLVGRKGVTILIDAVSRQQCFGRTVKALTGI